MLRRVKDEQVLQTPKTEGRSFHSILFQDHSVIELLIPLKRKKREESFEVVCCTGRPVCIEVVVEFPKTY